MKKVFVCLTILLFLLLPSMFVWNRLCQTIIGVNFGLDEYQLAMFFCIPSILAAVLSVLYLVRWRMDTSRYISAAICCCTIPLIGVLWSAHSIVWFVDQEGGKLFGVAGCVDFPILDYLHNMIYGLITFAIQVFCFSAVVFFDGKKVGKK